MEADALGLPATAAVAASDASPAWASLHRRRAARDGAWKVEVFERSSRGVTTRSVRSWHWHDPIQTTTQHHAASASQPTQHHPRSHRASSEQRSQQPRNAHGDAIVRVLVPPEQTGERKAWCRVVLLGSGGGSCQCQLLTLRVVTPRDDRSITDYQNSLIHVSKLAID